MKEVFKVAKATPTGKLAGAIAAAVGSGSEVELQAIGSKATYRAVKAIIIARTFLAQNGIWINASPSFRAVEINGVVKQAISLEVVRI